MRQSRFRYAVRIRFCFVGISFFQHPIHSAKRVMGIEPTCPAWKAGALPLSYTRVAKFESEVEIRIANLKATVSLIFDFNQLKHSHRSNFELEFSTFSGG